MADQGTQAVAYDSLRTILRALDEKDDDVMPMPDEDGPDWHYPEITPCTSAVCRYERVPTSDAADETLRNAEPVSEEDERPRPAPGKTRAAIAFAAPAAGLLLAVALFLSPAPSGQWARAALEELGLEEAIAQPARLASVGVHESAEAAEAVHTGPARGIQAFAELAQRALAARSITDRSRELPAAGD